MFDRLVNAGSWDHMQLVKYLASVRETLSSGEIKRLKATPIFPKEDPDAVKPDTPPPQRIKAEGDTAESPTPPPPVQVKRYPANALYAPNEVLAALGLPMIEWKGRWRATSDEAKLLFELGLLTHPTLDVLLTLASPPTDKDIQAKALAYLLENFKTQYTLQYSPSKVKLTFLPTTSGTLETPEVWAQL